jgi:hypothetical protein
MIGQLRINKLTICKSILSHDRFVLFLTCVPVTQMMILCLAIGNDPKPMNFGVVNRELNGSFCESLTRNASSSCDMTNLSCKYLEKLDPIIVPLVRSR